MRVDREQSPRSGCDTAPPRRRDARRSAAGCRAPGCPAPGSRDPHQQTRCAGCSHPLAAAISRHSTDAHRRHALLQATVRSTQAVARQPQWAPIRSHAQAHAGAAMRCGARCSARLVGQADRAECPWIFAIGAAWPHRANRLERRKEAASNGSIVHGDPRRIAGIRGRPAKPLAPLTPRFKGSTNATSRTAHAECPELPSYALPLTVRAAAGMSPSWRFSLA